MSVWHRRSGMACLGISLFVGSGAFAQSRAPTPPPPPEDSEQQEDQGPPWDLHEPTLLSHLAAHPATSTPSTRDRDNRSGDVPLRRFRTVVEYLGDVRPITSEHADVVGRAILAAGGSRNDMRVFKNELLIQQDGRSYWAPVREELRAHFARELKHGQPVEIFFFWPGVRGSEGLFVIEEFVAGGGD